MDIEHGNRQKFAGIARSLPKFKGTFKVSRILRNYYSCIQRSVMKNCIIAFSLVVSLTSVSGIASAKGCMKGAAVGGVAGHVAGKHGVAGAAAGCAVGHHRAAKKEKEQQAAQAQAGASSEQSGSTQAPPAKK